MSKAAYNLRHECPIRAEEHVTLLKFERPDEMKKSFDKSFLTYLE